MPDIDVIRAEIARMRVRFWGSAVESGNCSGRGYRAVLPKLYSKRCSTRSTISAPNATGSSENSQVTRGGRSEVGGSEATVFSPCALARP
jgi:hypothetical protein